LLGNKGVCRCTLEYSNEIILDFGVGYPVVGVLNKGKGNIRHNYADKRLGDAYRNWYYATTSQGMTRIAICHQTLGKRHRINSLLTP
jgi:hypothetical protein